MLSGKFISDLGQKEIRQAKSTITQPDRRPAVRKNLGFMEKRLKKKIVLVSVINGAILHVFCMHQFGGFGN